MEKAFNALEFLSQDEQTRQRYEARQKALHDYATAIETAKREGELTGELKERRATAIRLLLKGLSVNETAELANLAVKEVEAIAKTIQ